MTVSLASHAAAAPSPDANCAFAGQVEYAVYAQVPASIRSVIGAMAERGQPFQVTDDIGPGTALPGRRLIRAGRRGNDWFVWYEQGGIAYSWHAAAFRLDASGAKPRTLINVTVPVSWVSGGWSARIELCALIEGAFAGRVPPYPPGVSPTTYF